MERIGFFDDDLGLSEDACYYVRNDGVRIFCEDFSDYLYELNNDDTLIPEEQIMVDENKMKRA